MKKKLVIKYNESRLWRSRLDVCSLTREEAGRTVNGARALWIKPALNCFWPVIQSAITPLGRSIIMQLMSTLLSCPVSPEGAGTSSSSPLEQFLSTRFLKRYVLNITLYQWSLMWLSKLTFVFSKVKIQFKRIINFFNDISQGCRIKCTWSKLNYCMG